ncbi:SWAP1 ATPase, partial [Amia calva]|nr:SWAP1 ATPase [Amia calva]
MAASELGLKVLFLCPSPMQTLPAALQDGRASLDPVSLKKMKFVYPRSVEELLGNIARLHVQDRVPPNLVIVDGLDRYLCAEGEGAGEQQQQVAAHLSALLHDTASFLSQVLTGACAETPADPCRRCQVIASYSLSGKGQGEAAIGDPTLSVVERYFPVGCTLDREHPSAGAQEWRASFSGSPCTVGRGPQLGQQWRLTFSPSGAMECSVISEKSLDAD